MIQSAPCLSRVVPKMRRIRVAEHLSRRPRHPRALDDEELFIIEGSPGAQRPDGRSAKKARKTGEKPLLHRHRHKVRNPIFSTTCSCGISAVSATTCDCGACTTNTTGTSTTFQMYCNCEISMVWAIDLHNFLHYLDHRHLSLTTAGCQRLVMRFTWQLWNLDCLLHDLHQELGNLVKYSRPAPVEPARHVQPRRRPPCQRAATV